MLIAGDYVINRSLPEHDNEKSGQVRIDRFSSGKRMLGAPVTGRHFTACPKFTECLVLTCSLQVLNV